MRLNHVVFDIVFIISHLLLYIYKSCVSNSSPISHRMLPSYAYAVLLSAVVSRGSVSWSTLTLPDGDHHNCDLHWWRNLLYVTNMYSPHEQVTC